MIGTPELSGVPSTNTLAIMRIIITTTTFVISLVILSGCNSERSKTDSEVQSQTELRPYFLDKGGEVTAKTFKIMSGHLKSAIADEGVSHAIRYCNLNATGLVDSISLAQGVKIKRTSHKLRSMQNQPDSEENEVIQKYLSQAGSPEPEVRFSDDEVRYFAPIFIMEACLKCHGKLDSNVDRSDYAIIQDLYPHDEAIGFEVGDLRGIWSLEFDRHQTEDLSQ